MARGEETGNHPRRQVGRVFFSPSRTWEGETIPNSYGVRQQSTLVPSTDLYKGTIRKSADYGGRWTGVMYGHRPIGSDPADVPAFNVRTEHRARVAATALAQMPAEQAVRRTEGFRQAFQQRFEEKRGQRTGGQ
jgi:hypothetical protein